MSKSTRKTKVRKHYVPPKPYAKFPLTPHASGKWMKKIKGQLHYFGNWGRRVKGKMERVPGDGWEEALKLYKAQADDLHAGRQPEATVTDKLTVKDLCNTFLTAMHKRLQSGRKMGPRMFAEYRNTAVRLAAEFGKNRQVSTLRPKDFGALADDLNKFGTARLGNEVQRVKTIFKFAVDNDLIAKLPNYGSEFKKPGKDERRKERAKSAKRLFSAAEIRELLNGRGNVAGASAQLRAMILLAINCGFGNTDVSSLPQTAINKAIEKAGVLDFPRPKNSVERRCVLWPETIAALKVALADRPDPKDKADADCVFITAHGNRWVRDKVTIKPGDDADNYTNTKVVAINSVGLEFGKVLKRLGFNGRKGVGFYALRHTFRTVADACKDTPAVRLMMGHTDGSIDDTYRESIDNSRLQAVADHVHGWLFAAGVK